MANITGNGVAVRWERGGILKISDGTDVFTAVLVDPGSISVQDGGFALVEIKDRDLIVAYQRGEQLPGMFRFSGKFTGPNDATDLRKFLKQVPASGVNHQEYTIELQYPLTTGVPAASELTINRAVLDAPPTVTTGDGQNTDRIEASFRYIGNAVAGTLA